VQNTRALQTEAHHVSVSCILVSHVQTMIEGDDFSYPCCSDRCRKGRVHQIHRV
jgi:hypothetical protein